MTTTLALTPKQEAFCLAYLETGNASEAYRRSYSASRMSDKQIWEESCKLTKSPKVAQRLEELRAPVRAKAQLTLESHLARLEELSRKAEEEGQFSAAITAETNRGKASGLYTEKVDHTSSDGSMRPVATVDENVVKALVDKLID